MDSKADPLPVVYFTCKHVHGELMSFGGTGAMSNEKLCQLLVGRVVNVVILAVPPHLVLVTVQAGCFTELLSLGCLQVKHAP
eukprot:212422-Rhodomonas_salina.4